jgi:hypothetical protein
MHSSTKNIDKHEHKGNFSVIYHLPFYPSTRSKLEQYFRVCVVSVGVGENLLGVRRLPRPMVSFNFLRYLFQVCSSFTRSSQKAATFSPVRSVTFLPSAAPSSKRSRMPPKILPLSYQLVGPPPAVHIYFWIALYALQYSLGSAFARASIAFHSRLSSRLPIIFSKNSFYLLLLILFSFEFEYVKRTY